MPKVTWSHSSLKDFEGCARRYHEVKVLKHYPFQETEATRYGNQVHEALELYIRDGKEIPPQYAQFKDVADASDHELFSCDLVLNTDIHARAILFIARDPCGVSI